MSEPAIGWISEVGLDGADPWALAHFWAGLLGGTPVEWYPGWVTLEPPPNGQRQLAGRPDGPAQAGLVRPDGHSPGRPEPVDPGPWSPPARAA